ncbi:atrial natriuretic peptide receptor 1-like [Paramacrobiotus metropolitanus]|uniref:atrial natriuretic peptide receptor 1-like n=1 Tax=Paramacrobiotus metropolitanus TaxID=2943436 RepID=UPI002445F104|nr:atrial natriuretic peptide receptor 1-like [Paramacrobiotus metropolitanus]
MSNTYIYTMSRMLKRPRHNTKRVLCRAGIMLRWMVLVWSTLPLVSMETLLACFMSEGGSDDLFYNYQRSAAAVELALEYTNQVLLPGNITIQRLHVDLGPTCPDKVHVVSYAMQLMESGIKCDVYVGPGCSAAAEALYDIATYYKTLIIGMPAGGVGTLAPKKDYSYLTRISLTHVNTAQVLLRFLRWRNYTDITIIQDTATNFYQQMGMVFQIIYDSDAMDLAVTTKWRMINSSNVDEVGTKQFLEENQNRSRVFLLLMPSAALRKHMIWADKLGMTNGEYVYVGVNIFPSRIWGNFSSEVGGKNDEVAKNAYRSLLMVGLSLTSGGSYEMFSSAVKKLSTTVYNYTYKPEDEVNIVTSHFYDSVIYYGSLIRDAVNAGNDYRVTENLIALYQDGNYSFQSPVNDLVHINQIGDRQSAYKIQTYDYLRGDFDDFVTVTPNFDFVIRGEIFWPSGNASLPDNTPTCGFKGNNPACIKPVPPATIAVSVVIPLAVILAGVIVGIVRFRKYVERNSDPFWWRIFVTELSIQGNTTKSMAGSQVASTIKSHVSMVDKQSVKQDDDATTYVKAVSTPGAPIRAIYNGNVVQLKQLPEPRLRVTPVLGKSLHLIKRIQHQNVQKFSGIAVNDDNHCEFIVGEMCSKGSLTFLLQENHMNLDWEFKAALFKDLTAGMNYLHSSSLVSVGNLTSHTCLVDSNFVLKISEYGMYYFRQEEDLAPVTEHDREGRDYETLLWRAPELMRRHMPPEGTPKGDVYSYSIIVQQILLRAPPFRNGFHDPGLTTLLDREIIMEIKRGTVPPLRPRIPLTACPAHFRDLLEQCWDENPLLRPAFQRIREVLTKLLGRAGDNIVDYLIRTMEKYASKLEAEAEEKMRQFMEEKRRSEDILSQILPKSIAERLTKGQTVIPETYGSTTVYFSDVDGYSELTTEATTPLDVVQILNTLYTVSDTIIEKFDVYKVETVKDSYLVISGLPVRNGINHASEVSSLALTLRREINSLKISGLSFQTKRKLLLRVGLHSGPCVAAVIGLKMPRYCLFGDTVNTASRMESHGEPGKIQMSISTKELLDQIGGYIVVSRGVITVKGKGPMETFWLAGRDRE